jgi:hypothetical protein
VETFGVPLLKTKDIPASDLSNCEGSASAFLGTDPKRSEDYFHIAHQSGVNSSALDLSFGFQMPSDE